MSHFTLKLTTDNAAFEHPFTEVARILREAADRIATGMEWGLLLDANGNRVGAFELTIIKENR